MGGDHLMKWWRFYSEALDDPKVQLLDADIFRGWVNVLCIINETEPSRGPRSGYLPPRLVDTAYRLHCSEEDAELLLNQLMEHDLLVYKNKRYRARKWPARQPISDDVAARVSATRKKRTRNVTRNNAEGEGEEKRNRGDKDQEGEGEAAPPNGATPARPASGTRWDFALSLWAQNIGEVTSDARSTLKQYFEKSVDPTWINAAINETGLADRPGVAYFKRIIDACIREDRPPSILAVTQGRRKRK